MTIREGWWILPTGEAIPIVDHAGFLLIPANARRAGLPGDAIERIQAIPYAFQDGPARHAILYEGLRHGLVRVRGHRDYLTVETTRPLPEVLPFLAAFLGQVCGPLTRIKAHCLPSGPFLAMAWQDLKAILECEDLGGVYCRPGPPIRLEEVLATLPPEKAQATRKPVQAYLSRLRSERPPEEE